MGKILIAMMILLQTKHTKEECSFPQVAQNRMDNVYDYWVTKQSVSGRDPMAIRFHGSKMLAKPVGLDDKYHDAAYNRTCIGQVGTRFETMHMERRKTFYTCMEIVIRSSNVIQLKSGKLRETYDKNICEEKLYWNDWPLTAYFLRNNGWNFCPFQGGFHFSLFDHGKNKSVCANYWLPSTLQSECMPGDAMKLQFASKACLPDKTGWQEEQTLYCMTSWEEEDFTFIILNTMGFQPQWCMKIPKSMTGKFTAYIFQDLVCPIGDPPNGTRYLTLDMERRPTGGCFDEAVFCPQFQKLGMCQNKLIASYCKKSCKVCGEPEPCNLTSGAHLFGDWTMFTSGNETDDVSIQRSSVIMENFANFTCYKEWNQWTYSMATTFDNGCRTHYTCMKFDTPVPSLLRLHISQSKSQDERFDLCLGHNFRDDPLPLKDKFRSQNYKMLLSNSHSQKVSRCNLHGTFMGTQTKHDQNCTLEVSTNTGCGNGRHLVLQEQCGGEETSTVFNCLTSFKDQRNGPRTIVTLLQEESEYNCWLFDKYREIMYRLKSGQCNDDTQYLIGTGIITPIQTFRYEQGTRDKCKTKSHINNGNATTKHESSTTALSVGTVFGVIFVGLIVMCAVIQSNRRQNAETVHYRRTAEQQ